MGPFRVILTIILVIAELFLIAVVLLQSGKSTGLSGSIAGGAETFFGKNKAKSYEGKLQFLTKVAAISFIVIAIALSLLQ
ncbi:MAG TPA: preprotein translocase subunit SecG [Clostridiales bacterium]|jgi:preprotein translocase subunit SecG|nr:preprotein translocase subunit SecG [Clostridia bacterium]MDD4679985.1 preprotein translocase subunit SecG [Clostridia bacterium]HCS74610.1 preprotein translocase subunit SecG [Clostridiales bacterium]